MGRRFADVLILAIASLGRPEAKVIPCAPPPRGSPYREAPIIQTRSTRIGTAGAGSIAPQANGPADRRLIADPGACGYRSVKRLLVRQTQRRKPCGTGTSDRSPPDDGDLDSLVDNTITGG